MYTENDFWIPSKKWQLVEWFEKHYPMNQTGLVINWGRFNKKQLMAIYLDKRKRDERPKKLQIKITGQDQKEFRPEQLEFAF